MDTSISGSKLGNGINFNCLTFLGALLVRCLIWTINGKETHRTCIVVRLHIEFPLECHSEQQGILIEWGEGAVEVRGVDSVWESYSDIGYRLPSPICVALICHRMFATALQHRGLGSDTFKSGVNLSGADGLPFGRRTFCTPDFTFLMCDKPRTQAVIDPNRRRQQSHGCYRYRMLIRFPHQFLCLLSICVGIHGASPEKIN
jgi:hypothetical protein